MRLSTLGRLRLDGSGFTRPKPLLLLAYVALEGPQEKRHLAELFWPEAKSAMRSLNVALTQLRGGAPGSVEADERLVATPLATDVATFLERVEAGDLAEAEHRYGGAFLAGVHVPWGVELEEWALRTREFLAGHAREVGLRRAEADAAVGRFRPAARRAERAFALAGAGPPEPRDLARIHVLLLAGNSAHAGPVGREAEEFGLELPDTVARARKLLRGEPSAPERARASPLPAPSTAFVGREREAHSVVDAVREDCRLLSLLGPPGVGKTRLAVHCARLLERSGAFERVHFVALDAARDEPQMLSAIAATFHPEEASFDGSIDRIAHVIGARRVLLVLDNFEQLAAGAGRLSELLAACPNLRMLVTSRARLNLVAEEARVVAGLPVPRDPVSVEDARSFAAVELFTQRARRARPEFVLDDASLPAVLDVCRLVDGLPLGLEIAAAWLRMMSPSAVADELSESLDLLESSLEDVPERHRSLRNAIAWSWNLLGSREQQVLERLAVFRGGFTREAAQAVVGASVPLLAALVDKSLVRTEGPDRYGLHPLVAQFARERLAQHADAAQTRTRHADHFAALAMRAAPHLTGAEPTAWLRVLDAESDNTGAALDHLRSTDVGGAMRLAAYLWRYWIMRGHNRIGRERLAELVALPEAHGHPELRAPLLRSLGTITFQIGDFAGAEPVLQEALDLAREHADAEELAAVLNTLGWVGLHLGRGETSAAHCAEALHLHASVGNARGVALAHNNLGFLALFRGSLEEGRGHLGRSLQAFEALSDERGVAHLRINLALVEGLMGRREEAAARLDLAIDALADMGDEQLLVWGLYQRSGLALNRGRSAEAAADLGRALPLVRNVGNRELLGAVLTALADVHAEDARREPAERHLHEAQRTWRTAGYPWMWARTHLVAARVALLRTEPAAADAAAREGLAHLFAIGDRLGVALGLEELAHVLADRSPGPAGRLLGAAEHLRESIRAPHPPRFRARQEEALRSLRRRLGPQQFERAWRAGRSGGLEGAREEVAALG